MDIFLSEEEHFRILNICNKKNSISSLFPFLHLKLMTAFTIFDTFIFFVESYLMSAIGTI